MDVLQENHSQNSPHNQSLVTIKVEDEDNLSDMSVETDAASIDFPSQESILQDACDDDGHEILDSETVSPVS